MRLRYSPGDAIIRAGAVVSGLCVIWEGRVRVELNDRTGPAALALIEPAHIFGEDALLGEEPARFSIVAEDEVHADVIDGRVIRELVAGCPAFATRFFRSLASLLFERLSRIAEKAAPPFA
jgi:CRP-like cAMP-binding protein